MQAYSGRIIEFKSGPEGFDTRSFFYEGEHEVVAFDAQFTPDLAKQAIAFLRTFTQKPISWLVITHPNPDKFNGASVFKNEGARIIASKHTADDIPGVQAYKEYFFVEIAKMFKKGSYPQPTAVDQIFEGKMDLVLRVGQRIELRELTNPGVTTIDSWIADLKELGALYPLQTMIYSGRGQQASLETATQAQIQYLKTAVLLIRNYLKKLGAVTQELNGPYASSYYKDLAKEFSREFPEYDLAYMIEYGAYGLVQQELSKVK